MYDVSEKYQESIRGHTRKYNWTGTITTKSGKVYPFTAKDIVKGSGTLTRSCSGGTSLEIGSVYAAELDISFFLEVDRYSLYDAVIDLSFTFQHSMGTWGDLASKTWNFISSYFWKGIYSPEEIPMGRFVVAEATRTLTVIQLKAYDYMLKFDKNMVNNGSVKTAYEWLQVACNACGVELGVSEEEVAAMPNGTKNLSYTISDDVKTYRDLISQVATVLCGVCQINRMGRLVVIPFSNTPTLDIPASWRYSSQIADYITRYTGLYATYRAGGLTEYVNVEPDDGLIYNIGTNPFLQISSETDRQNALQSIIDHLSGITYTPFEAEIPSDPSLDPMDVLSLSGGQAQGEIACITEIIIKVNGKTSLKCVGENPRLNQAKSRYTKDIEGLIASTEGMEGTSTFWMSDAYGPAGQVIKEEDEVVAATEFEIQTDKARGAVIWTGTYYLDTAADVTAKVYLDEELIYTCKDLEDAGYTTLTISTPFEIRRGDEGVHEVRIVLACVDTQGADNESMAAMLTALANRVRQLEEGFNNELEVETEAYIETLGIIGDMNSETSTTHITPTYQEHADQVCLDPFEMFGSVMDEAEGETG